MPRTAILPARLLGAAWLLFTVAAGAATPDGRQFLMTRHVRDAAAAARPVGRLPADRVLHLDIVLPPANPAALESFLADVYDPASPAYHHFLTPREFTRRFGPAAQDWEALRQYATANGFVVVGGSRDEMDLRLVAPVAAIERAFHVKMQVYQHPTEPRTFYSPDREPTVDVGTELWHVSGLDDFSPPRPRLTAAPATQSQGSCPGGAFCGSDMRAAYYGAGPLTGAGQSVGLVEFHGYDAADLAAYFAGAGETNTVPVNAISTDGSALACTHAAGCDDTEQTLDMTQVLGMAPGLAQLNVYVGSSDSAILSAMSVVPPNSVTGQVDAQLSCSWNWAPADPATDDPIFAKFAAQGQTFLVAAGDNGAYTTAPDQVVYPADDPNVTVVGGTTLTTQGAGGAWAGESAWPSGGGGAVVADNVAIPAWQTAALAAYNAESTTPGSTTLRNSPDVAAAANAAFYVCADQAPCATASVGGSSFATPMWAGFVALANEAALASGQTTLGFLNPTLYAIGGAGGGGYAAAFHDVTSGSNGFLAATGYDPATGWGSPNGQGLITALLAAAAPTFTLSASGGTSASQGGTATLTLATVAFGGFAAPIQLSAAGQPAAVTVAFAPASVSAGGGSTVTFSVGTNAVPGSYRITFSGTGGGVTRSATATLTVTQAGFTLSTSGALAVAQGGSGSATLTTTVSGGFVPAIALSVAGLPAGVTATLGAGSLTGNASTTLTFAVAANAAAGSYPVVVTAVAGTLTQSAVVPLTVSVATFSVAASGPVSVPQGGSGTVTLTASVSGGFSAPIQLSAYGQPTGVTLAFGTPTLNGAGSSVLTVAIAPTVPAGVYTLTLAGTSGVQSSTALVTLTVTAATFQLSSSGAFQIGQGDSGTATVTSTISGGFAAPVTLTASGGPAGAVLSFAPSTFTGAATSVLSVTVPATAPPGLYPIVVTGTSGYLTRTATVPMTVVVPGFTVTVSPTASVSQGASGSAVVATSAVDGFAAAITLAATGLPVGMTASFSPATVTGTGSAQLTFQAAANTAAGTYPITVTGTSGSLVVTTSLQVTVVPAGFYLTAPTFVSVPEAQSATLDVTSTAVGGFTGTIALSARNLPNGVTASFSPATLTGAGSSVATLSIATTTPAGSYPITLVGTSGTVVETSTVTLDISSATFTLAATPTLAVPQGGSGNASVTSTSTGGFAGPVALAVSGLPAGVTAAFSPSSLVGTASSTLTFTVADDAAGGTYPVVVSGSSGGLTRTANLTLTITGPAFHLSQGGAMSVPQGGTTSTTVTTTVSGAFANAIALTASGQPPGVGLSFSPASLTGAGTATLTATVAGTVPTGVYAITVTGTSGLLRQTVSVTLTVTAAGFALVPPGSVSVAAGGSGTLTVTNRVSGGFDATVFLGATGLPAGVTVAFSPTTLSGGGYSAMTLAVGSGVAPGSYAFTVTGASGNVTQTAPATLVVLPQGFSFAASGPVTVAEGATAAATVTSTVVSGFSGVITLGASGAPAGLLVSFSPATLTGAGTTAVTFSAGAGVPPGTYSIVISGKSGSLSASTTIPVTVTAASFAIAAASTLSVPEGTSGGTGIAITTTGGFGGQIALAASGQPTGVTLSFNPATVTGAGSSTLTATVAAGVPQGTYALTVKATSGNLSKTLVINLVVVAPGYALTVSGPVTATQGGSGSATLTAAASGGFSGTIALTASGLPAGVTASFAPTTITGGGTAKLTLAASSSARVGTYTVSVTGTSGTVTRAVPVTLTVN